VTTGSLILDDPRSSWLIHFVSGNAASAGHTLRGAWPQLIEAERRPPSASPCSSRSSALAKGLSSALTWRFAALMSHACRRDDWRDVLTSQPRDIRRMGHDHKMTGEGSSAKTDFEHALLKSCSLLTKTGVYKPAISPPSIK